MASVWSQWLSAKFNQRTRGHRGYQDILSLLRTPKELDTREEALAHLAELADVANDIEYLNGLEERLGNTIQMFFDPSTPASARQHPTMREIAALQQAEPFTPFTQRELQAQLAHYRTKFAPILAQLVSARVEWLETEFPGLTFQNARKYEQQKAERQKATAATRAQEAKATRLWSFDTE